MITTSITAKTFGEILRQRAQVHPDKPLYTFLSAEGDIDAELTFGDLEVKARTVAAYLSERGLTGKRCVLLFPPGLDFTVAFCGCLMAGVTAVPAYPPRTRRAVPGLVRIALDALPAAILTDSVHLERFRRLTGAAPELAALRWITTDDLLKVDGFMEPVLDANSVALLQYTSGSTGDPKGVMVSHQNLLANEAMIQRAFAQKEDSVVVGWLPPYHDMGLIGNLLQPVYSGARCVLMAPMSFLTHPRRWLEAIGEYRGTTSGGPNFAYELCLRKIALAEREGLDLSSWEVAFNGAEPIRAETLERFAKAFEPYGFKRQAFHPCYGLAEATLFVTGVEPGRAPSVATFDRGTLGAHRVEASEGGVPLVGSGVPDPELEVLIVDPETRVTVTEDHVGEIWVAGSGVAGGYWGKPEMSAEHFAAHREDDPAAGPYLRTGDLGFFAEGELFVTGRLKDLIILRGRNFYPQDLEGAAEGTHPQLRPGAGAAFAIEVKGEEQVVMVWEVRRVEETSLDAVIDALQQAVFEACGVALYEVVLLRSGSLLKTTSGKVRRRETRRQYLEDELKVVGRSAAEEPLTAAADVLQQLSPDDGEAAASAWLRREVARLTRRPVARIALTAPLTHLGLDSLAAVTLSQRMEGVFGVSLEATDLLGELSLEELARRLLSGTFYENPLAVPLVASEVDGPRSLTSAQQRLWFLDKLRPESAAYNISSATWLRGTLDSQALNTALVQVIARHATLRTTIRTTKGQPQQIIAPTSEAALEVIDLVSQGPDAARKEARRQAETLARQPFDLGVGPLLRALLLQTAQEEYLFVLVVHHIVSDGWSMGVLGRELGTLYRVAREGTSSPLPTPSVQYADVAEAERDWLTGDIVGEQLAFWRKELAGTPTTLELPTDRPRPPIQSYRGGLQTITLGAPLRNALVKRGESQGATLFMTLLAAFASVLARTSGQREVVVGAPVANRKHWQVRELIGFFVNTLALRIEIADHSSWSTLLDQVRQRSLSAYANSDIPFERLVEELDIERTLDRSPLFQAMLVLQPEVELALPEIEIERFDLHNGSAKFDLTLIARGDAAGLVLALEYNSELFDTTTAERLLNHVGQQLAEFAEGSGAPLTTRLGTSAARHQALVEWNDTARDFSAGQSVPEQFAERLLERPDALAIAFGSMHLSFRELGRRVMNLTTALRTRGVRPEERVGLAVERSPEMLVGILGILTARATYVPLDPGHPPQRLATIATEAELTLTVADASSSAALPDDFEIVQVLASNPVNGPYQASEINLDQLAYALYTSGSTGIPKGVMVTHRSLANLLTALNTSVYRGVPEPFRVAQSAPLIFDASVKQWLQILAGRTLVVTPESARLNPKELRRFVASQGIDAIDLTPGQLTAVLDSGGFSPGARPRRLLVGGEAVPASLWRRLATLDLGAWNVYGPTECTVDAAVQEIRALPQRPRLGRPVAGVRLFVTDRHLGAAPLGVVGELTIAGTGVARGYLARPALTAERFVPDPWSTTPGGRLYRTGDLGRTLQDGTFEFLGRFDHQVKLRGFRIELGEIEAALDAQRGVRQAVAVVREDEPGKAELVVYAVYDKKRLPSSTDLRAALTARLPAYMVPAIFVQLDKLPRTAAGKVDRTSLPRPDRARGEIDGAMVAPRSPVEEVLVGMVAEVLGLDEVGIYDNFFELGGHSLLATELVAMMEEAFDIEVPLLQFFESPSIGNICDFLLEDPDTRHKMEAVAPMLLEMAEEGG